MMKTLSAVDLLALYADWDGGKTASNFFAILPSNNVENIFLIE